jgi:hypothetical protein
MPLALRRLGPLGGRILVLGERLRLGRDPALEVVIDDPRVRSVHARLRPLQGEWVVAAEGDAPLFVNGREVPFFALRDGDRLELADPGSPSAPAFVLEDALAGAFVRPGASRWEAWLAQPASRAAQAGPARYGVDPAELGPQRFVAVGRVHEGGGACLVEVGAPLAAAIDCERALAVAVSVAGAPHPSLAPVLDAGVWADEAGLRPWIVSRQVQGRSAAEVAAGPPLGVGPWLRVMAAAARGLAWLHQRGCLLRRVAPERLVLTPNGGARLDGYLDARMGGAGVEAVSRPEGSSEGGSVSTAAADLHGLCAVGCALRVGGSGGEGRDRLAGLGLQGRSAPVPGSLGLGMPRELEDLLLEGLSPEPAQRPKAADLARRLEGLSAVWGLEPASH